jgi:hypothetical protein
VELVLATLAQEGAREGAWLVENWSGRGDTDVRGWRHRPSGDKHPRRGQRINALRMQPAEAELTGVVKRLLPRQSGRAQNLLRLARCKSRGCTGTQRVRVLVVEKFEWQSSEGRIEGACPAWRCKATRREQQQVPSRKEAEPSEETPDDGGRWREGELGAQVSRVIVKDSR